MRLLHEMSDQTEARLDNISKQLDEIQTLLGHASPGDGGESPVEPSDVELATFGDSLPPELRAIYDSVQGCRHDVAGVRGVVELVRKEAAASAARLERIESGVSDAHDGFASLSDEVSSLASDVRAASEQRIEGRARMPQRHGATSAQAPGIGQSVGPRAGLGGGASRGWGPPQVLDDGLGQAAYDELSQRVSESCDEIRSIMKSSVRDIASIAMNIRDSLAAVEPRALPSPPASEGHVPAADPSPERLARLACALSGTAAVASLLVLALQVVG